jgi:hypothetical protein
MFAWALHCPPAASQAPPPRSGRRTFDPEEADFFYVPMYTSCYAHPVHGYLDGPWWWAARLPAWPPPLC